MAHRARRRFWCVASVQKVNAQLALLRKDGTVIYKRQKFESVLIARAVLSLEPLSALMYRTAKDAIERAMILSGGNVSKAARVLQIKRTTLQMKLQKIRERESANV